MYLSIVLLILLIFFIYKFFKKKNGKTLFLMILFILINSYRIFENYIPFCSKEYLLDNMYIEGNLKYRFYFCPFTIEKEIYFKNLVEENTQINDY